MIVQIMKSIKDNLRSDTNLCNDEAIIHRGGLSFEDLETRGEVTRRYGVDVRQEFTETI